ncbi:MAG: Crp/Fnr family transcriptional regulator [Nitrospirota bacterium]
MAEILNEKDKAAALKNIQLFSELSDREVHQIGDKLAPKIFKKNETILYEEDTSEFMYIILSGKVKVIKTTGEGKEIILAMHNAGSFFGEMSLIDGKTSPASVIATEDSIISIISKNDFYSLLFAHKKVLETLLKILSSRLRTSWDTIKLLNFNNASQRIRTLFFMLAEEHGKRTSEGIVLNANLSHKEISEMTGLTRETVTRVMDKWQKAGEVAILKNKSVRLNPAFHKRDDLKDLQD